MSPRIQESVITNITLTLDECDYCYASRLSDVAQHIGAVSMMRRKALRPNTYATKNTEPETTLKILYLYSRYTRTLHELALFRGVNDIVPFIIDNISRSQ